MFFCAERVACVSGSGELEFEEFCILSARFLIEEDAEAMQQELREAFRLYDKEGNGYITTDVLREILRELDNTITSQDLDDMIEEIDSDGSGTVDFDGKLTLDDIFLINFIINRITKNDKKSFFFIVFTVMWNLVSWSFILT